MHGAVDLRRCLIMLGVMQDSLTNTAGMQMAGFIAAPVKKAVVNPALP